MELPTYVQPKGRERNVPQYLQRIPVSEKVIIELAHSFRKQYGIPDEGKLLLSDALVIFQYVLKQNPDFAYKYLENVRKWHLDFLPHVQAQLEILKAKQRSYWALSLWDFLITA